MGIKQPQAYHGIEQGPIRPPSEATSLLLRITRNCPWNRCTFCSVYKSARFSLRPVEHIIQDIDAIHEVVERIVANVDGSGNLTTAKLQELAEDYVGSAQDAFVTAVNWLVRGEGSVFLQDANSLIMKPRDLITILTHLKSRFPWITRITSYARSHTINRISDEDMLAIAETGLNRIHIGMESGCNEVLDMTAKGVTQDQHVAAGQRVLLAGIELSEYVMPGLGGVAFSEKHAADTAAALNQINPHFIRLRTLTVPPGIPLYDQQQAGEFVKPSDLQIVTEIRQLLEALQGITSTFRSDHFNNLLEDVDGKLPGEKATMLGVLDSFLELEPSEQALFQLGRRMGYFHAISDLADNAQRERVAAIYAKLDATPDTIDEIIAERIRPSL